MMHAPRFFYATMGMIQPPAAIARFASVSFLLCVLQGPRAQPRIADRPARPSQAARSGAGPITEAQTKALRSGLLAEYRTLMEESGAPPLRRIDSKPSFTWANSSPHPRLPGGPFEVTWTGSIDLKDKDAFHFSVWLSGEVRIVVDGMEVLREQNLDKERWYASSASLLRAPGIYRIQIFYRSPTGGPARLQVWWSGKSFAPEPIPAYRFGHLDDEVPQEWRRDAKIERGWIIVGQYGCAQC